MHCPTKDDTLASLLASLPSGRAWQTHDGGPAPYHDAAFDPNAFDPASFDGTDVKGTILYRFWEAVAYVVNFANGRLCALALEMFCASIVETRDQWMIEYGLPDACDPFPDLCTKVAAIGGTRCEYYQEVASRAGWTIGCTDDMEGCGAQCGCDYMGDAESGPGFIYATLLIVVDLTNSPAFSGPNDAPPLSGAMLAGMALSCPPDISPLICIIERIVHAEILVLYQTL